MIIAKNQSELSAAIAALKNENPSAKVGFVPTMGALHPGHMTLIANARQQTDIVVCSIFVNPTQFNNPKDLETYPRTIDADKELLLRNGCNILLLPDFDSVYPNGVLNYEIDLGGIDKHMEGAFRPGHFKGVCMVVERFFEMVKPEIAFFGLKDFQQLAVIKKMVQVKRLPVTIVGVPIARAESGLALSSRNALLSDTEKEEAALIHKALLSGMNRYKETVDAMAIRSKIESEFLNSSLTVEYISFVDNNTLQEVNKVDANTTVCIVVYCGNVRLIDNMQFSEAK
ncbi:pantoate--beta-alanine ligase [Crocinitomix algicola]|uniref:pantoate--beta-alanine ligase n=1 Tax=Crocinitomix algicola TaxID=1740263 RepID=UPI0008724968|nr:pantoate--beta-alanine ligase [Crocinitomix algicola]